MPIEVKEEAGVIRFDFEGRMDTLGSNSAEQDLKKVFGAIEEDKLQDMKIVFNLEKVDFVSSSFMRICLKYAKKVAKNNLELINTDLKIKKTFKIAGLDKILKID